MRLFSKKTLIFALFSLLPFAAWAQSADAPRRDTIWEVCLAGDVQDDYNRAVESLFARWEASGGRPLVPGAKRRVTLKINTQFGPGLSTPKPLIRAVAAALEKRGFKRDEMLLFDLYRRNLIESNFLSPLPDAPRQWEGMPLMAFDEAGKIDPKWFYDSPLPTLDRLAQASQLFTSQDLTARNELDRKSFLPTTLFLDCDFWINLPAVCDSPGILLDGVLSSGTVRAITNNDRFIYSSSNGPVAIAEIAAIPEWKRSWVFSILSLENFQYIGGPVYNAYYTGHEPLLWLSDNPVWMDYQLFLRFNDRRKWAQLPAMDEPLMLNYAKSLGLGDYDAARMRIERVY